MIPSGAAVLAYIIGSAAGVNMLGRGLRRTKKESVFPLISLMISIVVLPFIGPLLAATYVAAYHKNRPTSPKIRSFRKRKEEQQAIKS